jgi:hypothetical protein
MRPRVGEKGHCRFSAGHPAPFLQYIFYTKIGIFLYIGKIIINQLKYVESVIYSYRRHNFRVTTASIGRIVTSIALFTLVLIILTY